MNEAYPDPMPENVSDASWTYLGQLVTERRQFIGLTQAELAQYGGPKKTSVSKIERAVERPYSPRTLQQLEKALGWSRGAIRSILTIAESDGFNEEEAESTRIEYVEAILPDLTQTVMEAESASRASELSDDELLAELTYRMKRYAALQEEGSGTWSTASPEDSRTGSMPNPFEDVHPNIERGSDATGADSPGGGASSEGD